MSSGLGKSVRLLLALFGWDIGRLGSAENLEFLRSNV